MCCRLVLSVGAHHKIPTHIFQAPVSHTLTLSSSLMLTSHTCCQTFTHTLSQVYLDDISVADAVAIGLCVMPALTHLTLESNASAIGVTGAAGLVTLTSLRELILPTQALGDQGLQVGVCVLVEGCMFGVCFLAFTHTAAFLLVSQHLSCACRCISFPSLVHSIPNRSSLAPVWPTSNHSVCTTTAT